MENEKIIAGNKLIAEFEKLIVEKPGDLLNATQQNKYYHPSCFNYPIPLSELQYHSSWDWLIPVFEKICRLTVGDGVVFIKNPTPTTFGMLNEETGQIMVRIGGFTLWQADTLIEATWLAVIEFIEWYNEFNKQGKEKP